MEDFLKQCKEAVVKGDKALSKELAAGGLEKGYNILQVVEEGFSAGIKKAGELWEAGEYFLPELAFSAEAMKAAMDVLQPALLESSQAGETKGKVIIGTIQGDIHDIGKTLVATMLAANGYVVIDLGADVSYDRFIEEATKQEPKFLCMSALLTTTMRSMEEIIHKLKETGIRDHIKVLIGGAPTSQAFADQIGADAHCSDAFKAVEYLQQIQRA